MDSITAPSVGLAPFSLKDAPALIERVFPAQKIGIEAQKERKANVGQTLTALGSYWKGRKPLVLVRACVLASLLPATSNPEADLEVFDLLMRMDAEGMWRRKPKVTAAHVWTSPAVGKDHKAKHIRMASEHEPNDANPDIDAPSTGSPKWVPIAARTQKVEAAQIRVERKAMMTAAFHAMPFSQKVFISDRVEAVEDLGDDDDPFYSDIWERVNKHLGTNARSLPNFIEQLGIARFGHRSVVGDPFCGGGSIPFEAARVGCNVIASDLNPVAAMLTWGGLNIIGAAAEVRTQIIKEQQRVAFTVDAELTRLQFEHDTDGNRAKAYLYCMEVVDPQTGWRVPMAPSWVISEDRRCVAKLVPNYDRKRFDIRIESGVTARELDQATRGTVRDSHLVYRLAPSKGGEERDYRIAISRLRGDGAGSMQPDATRSNRLRPWESHDVVPHEPVWVADAAPVIAGATPGAWVGGDTWLERLYAIQWMDGKDLKAGKPRPNTHFAEPTADDLDRELKVITHVQECLSDWQAQGLIPDMRIEPGEKTDEPVRTRGWTCWHHLFAPRQLLCLALTKKEIVDASKPDLRPAMMIALARSLDRFAKLCRWSATPAKDIPEQIFSNQALNVFFNYAVRAHRTYQMAFDLELGDLPQIRAHAALSVKMAHQVSNVSDVWIFDPPYADAVHYHEITEFFIAWLRSRPPLPFNEWIWDSRRPLAIQGKGEKFRSDMVSAFQAMADHMPDNGLQVCMFTHKDAGVWADMAGIVWGAGLRVSAAWYVSTERESEFRDGGHVQGTVLLILRKRRSSDPGEEQGYRSDIVPEIRARVAAQVETLTGLNQTAIGKDRNENIFSDADVQMAGYAAALEVLTSYTHIDGIDMTREALRPREARRRGQAAEIGIVEEMIDLAVQTANEMMVPEGLPDGMWERLGPAERFYLKMSAAESVWPEGTKGGKLDNYQNFAKAYRADGWEDLMADRQPNRARLKSATELRGSLLHGHPISPGALRPTLYAVMGLARDAEKEADPTTSGAQALHGLRDHFGDAEWLRARDNVRTLAMWLGRTWEQRCPGEAAASRVLASLVASERL